jgi:hypothetical protein
MCRPDVIHSIVNLSRNVTKWKRSDDVALCALYSYLKATSSAKLKGRIYEDISSLRLLTYVDADFCGSVENAKSISGGICFLSNGPDVDSSSDSAHTAPKFPLEWWSKKQGSTATSTTEAEMTSLQKGVKEHGVPFECLIEQTTGVASQSLYYEDNMSCIAIVGRGYSSILRHLAKTARVSVSFLFDAFHENSSRKVIHVGTAHQAADALTKALSGPKMKSAWSLLGLE